MEEKKIYFVTDNEDSPKPVLFSQKDRAEKFAAFLGKNHLCNQINITDGETDLIDSTPLLTISYETDAACFLQEKPVFPAICCEIKQEYHKEQYPVNIRLRSQSFLVERNKEYIYETWKEMLVKHAKIDISGSFSHGITESELEDGNLSEETQSKVMDSVLKVYNGWFAHVVEKYPVTSVYIAEEAIYFSLLSRNDAYYDSPINIEQENEKGITIFQKGKRYDEYFFETKDGQMFLDSLSEKMRNQV